MDKLKIEIHDLYNILKFIRHKTDVPRRVNPTCRSGGFRSDPHRISSESDISHKKPIGSNRVFVGFLSVGFRPEFRRNLTETDEIRVGSGRISIVFRRIPTKSGSESDKNSVGSDRNYFDPTGSDHPSVTWGIISRTTVSYVMF
jgi:hypothetical protein